MAFVRYKQLCNNKLRCNASLSLLIDSTNQAVNTSTRQSPKRNFRKLALSQEKETHKDICLYKNQKDQLASKFNLDVKNYYGHNEDPRKNRTLTQYYYQGTQPCTNANLSTKDKVDLYYQSNVINTQSNLNTSCYKNQCCTISKEEYNKILNEQTMLKVKRKEVLKRSDSDYIKSAIAKEKEAILIERKAKMTYANQLKENFKETNHNLALINRTIKEANKTQQLKDERKHIKVTLMNERKLEVKERMKVNYSKEYLNRELKKQMVDKVKDAHNRSELH